MTLLIKNGTVYTNGRFEELDLYINNKGFLSMAKEINIDADEVIDATNLHVLPGFIDAHVHLREPGFSYKETIKSGSLAAARGGYTTILAMPNLNPVPDYVEEIVVQKKKIKQDACVHVIPYGSITKGQRGGGELVDFQSMARHCIAFSDDGKGIQEEAVMCEAMKQASKFHRVIVAHCEDESELHGGCIHEGEYAKEHGYIGINSESEWKQIERDIRLAKETSCQYHVCHVSTKEGVALIRQAKKEGLKVSGEVTVHHLLLCDQDIQGDDGNYKMNPPLRDASDQSALLQGLQDGTLEIIATDHAPHSEAEKSKGLVGSAMGVVGLETAFSLLYTHLVKINQITLKQLVDCMSGNVAKLFELDAGEIVGQRKANLTIVDLEQQEIINRNDFLSLGRNTPFHGWKVQGIPIMTMVDGNIVYRRQLWKEN